MTATSAPGRTGAGSRWHRVATPVATTAGLAGLTLALHVRDPHEQYSWGFCPSAMLGFWCPGCGGLRAVNDLTHLDVAAAASSNLLVVAALPFAVLALVLWTLDRWRGAPAGARYRRLRRLLPALLVLVAAFVLVRNLTVGAWLAP
jgi:hypothetical protein